MLALVLASCRDPETPPADDGTDTPPGETGADTGTSATGETGTTWTTPPGNATCAPSATNALRVECTATLQESGDALLELAASGLPTRTFTSRNAVSHEIVGWGLAPGTTYTWSLAGQSGEVTTGSLPPDLTTATITATGDPGDLAFDAVLQPLGCAVTWMVMIEPRGQIVWYELEEVFRSRQDGYEWSQVDRSVLTIGSDTVLERHVSGEERLRLERNVHYDDGVHHDLHRWDRYTYVLFERRVGSANVDGIYVFDGTSAVGTFFLGDHYVVPDTMGDWSHANGLQVDDAGQITMSILNFDAVLGIDGDPASPTFLEPTWLANGGPSGLPDPTFTAVGGGWEGQHNALRVGDELWMFDNLGGVTSSRGLRVRLDELAGEATIDREWRVDPLCPVQGGAIPLDGGGVLVTCSSSSEVSAFGETDTDPRWTLQATCTGDTDTMIRGIPVLIE